MLEDLSIQQSVRQRIEQEYAKNPNYAFTTEDFIDLLQTREDRQLISIMFSKLSSHGYRKKSRPTLKKIGVTRLYGKQGTVNVYQVISTPLVSKQATKNKWRQRNRTTPETVLDLQNILFGMRGTNV